MMHPRLQGATYVVCARPEAVEKKETFREIFKPVKSLSYATTGIICDHCSCVLLSTANLRADLDMFRDG
jgi:hypothetical protein